MKRVMGVDFGDARTGIAVSDLLCSIVGTTTVIHSRNTEKTIAQICEMVKASDVGEIVVGRCTKFFIAGVIQGGKFKEVPLCALKSL